MNLLNFGDFLDAYIRLRDRGWQYMKTKLHLRLSSRILGTWEDTELPLANWWQIPAMQEHWNEKISGDKNVTYPMYVASRYLSGKQGLTMLSVGCGSGGREMEFGATGLFSVIDAFDFTPKCIAEAKIEAKKRGLPMMNFFVGDTYKFDFSTKQYDIILFEHSLHHFKNVDSIVKKVKTAMHSNSLLVANEYVGVDRFQFPKQRLVDSDLVLKKIPKKFRQRRLPGYYKNKIYAPGLWRVIQSDPSEAVESSTVLPALHAHFKVVEERGWGGNLLHFLLKDITHNFNGIDPETNEIMEFLFSEEDRLIEKEGQHDFLFGVYAKE